MADKTNDANDDSANSSNQDKIRAAIQGASDAPTKDDHEDDADLEDDKELDADAEADDSNNDDDSNDEGDDDSANDDSDDEAGDDDKEEKSDVKLSQFKGDGKRGSYTKNLENGFIDQAQKLNDADERAEVAERQVTAIRQAASKDPEFGKKLLELLDVDGGGDSGGGASNDSNAGGGKSPADEDPFLVDAKTQWKSENDKSTKDFVENNPEVLTDPQLNKKVKHLMQVFSNDALKTEGRLMKGGEAMEKAYQYLGLDVKRKQQQDLADGMKKGAAPTRPNRPKKPSKGNAKQFSDLTLSLAGKMGISKDRLVKGSRK